MARAAHLNAKLDFKIEELSTAEGANSATVMLAHNFAKTLDYPTGTSAEQVDRVWSASDSAGTGGDSHDLATSGTLVSAIATGAATVIVELQLLIIENTGSVDLRIGAVANTIPCFSGSTDYIVIPAGGFIVWHFGTAGLTVTAATADILKVASASGTCTYKIILVGRSA